MQVTLLQLNLGRVKQGNKISNEKSALQSTLEGSFLLHCLVSRDDFIRGLCVKCGSLGIQEDKKFVKGGFFFSIIVIKYNITIGSVIVHTTPSPP